MADLLLHIKDGYYFEVPKSLWRHHWTDMKQVPEWLRKANPEVTDVESMEQGARR